MLLSIGHLLASSLPGWTHSQVFEGGKRRPPYHTPFFLSSMLCVEKLGGELYKQQCSKVSLRVRYLIGLAIASVFHWSVRNQLEPVMEFSLHCKTYV